LLHTVKNCLFKEQAQVFAFILFYFDQPFLTVGLYYFQVYIFILAVVLIIEQIGCPSIACRTSPALMPASSAILPGATSTMRPAILFLPGLEILENYLTKRSCMQARQAEPD